MYRTTANQGQVMVKTNEESFFMTGRCEFRPMCFLFGQSPTIKTDEGIINVKILQMCLSRDHVMAEVIAKHKHQGITDFPARTPSDDSLIMKHTHPKSFFMCGRSEFRPMHALFSDRPILMDRGEEIPVEVLQTCISREYCLAEVVKVADYYEEDLTKSRKVTMEDIKITLEGESSSDKGASFISGLRRTIFGE